MKGLHYSNVILLSVTCLLSSFGSAKQMSCTGEWQSIHRACYKFNMDLKTWQEALDACAGEGGSLLSIGSASEYKKITKAIQKRINTNKMLQWWIGLKRSADTGHFDSWLDGIPFSARVTQWSPSEPNNRRNKEHCAEIKFDGKLNDKDCSITRPFVCELNEITQIPTFHTTVQATTRATTLKTTQSTTTKIVTSPKPDNEPQSTLANTPMPTSTERLVLKTTVPTKEMKPRRQDLSKYSSCFNYKSIVRNIKKQESTDNLEFVLPTTCPSMVASGVTWSQTEGGKDAVSRCKSGTGTATFVCGENPVCWRSEPNVSGCASPKFKNVLKRTKKLLQGHGRPGSSQGGSGPVDSPDGVAPPMIEVSVNDTLEVTDALAEVTASNDMSFADVILTSQVMESLTRTTFSEGPRSTKDVKNIVLNVVKAGSNIVSKNKSSTWSDMNREDKVRCATSLLVAMESATVNMAKSLDEPIVIQSKDESIDMELHVLNVSSMDSEPLVYGDQESQDNTFSIPKETLQQLSNGGLAKAVFMTHYQMADILQEDDVENDEEDGENVIVLPIIASYVISASLGGEYHVKLPQPITFTMKHVREFPVNSVPLCSFLILSAGSTASWSQDGCKVVKSGDTHTTCECDHLTNFAILMDVQGVEISIVHSSLLSFITLVGCIISCICLFVCWITFNCFSSIQGERTTIHKNLVFCLFVAEVLFLVGIDKTENKLACSLIAGFLHYFFLTAFTWMFLEGLHIICMLVQVFDAAKSRLPYYYFVGYGFPLAIVAVSAGVFYEGYGTDKYCWLTTERYFVWSFAGPIAVVLLVNTFILIYAMFTVCRHSEYVFSGKDKNGTDMRSWIQGAMAIEVILGLTWIFGYCFISQETIALAYIFTILNSLQGLFIFCFHCLLNKKVLKEYKRIFHITKRPVSSTQSASLMRKQGASYEMSHPSQSLTHSNTDSRA